MQAETLNAWAAGFFDGEGSVSIYILHRPNRTTKELRILAQVSQHSRQPLQVLAEHYGGVVLGPYNKSYKWTLTNMRCRKFLETILPYSIVKRQEIDLALQALRMQRRRGESGARRPKPDGTRGWCNEPFYTEAAWGLLGSLREQLIELNAAT